MSILARNALNFTSDASAQGADGRPVRDVKPRTASDRQGRPARVHSPSVSDHREPAQPGPQREQGRCRGLAPNSRPPGCSCPHDNREAGAVAVRPRAYDGPVISGTQAPPKPAAGRSSRLRASGPADGGLFCPGATAAVPAPRRPPDRGAGTAPPARTERRPPLTGRPRSLVPDRTPDAPALLRPRPAPASQAPGAAL